MDVLSVQKHPRCLPKHIRNFAPKSPLLLILAAMTTYEPDSREAWDHFGRVMNWIIGVTIAVLIGCCIACCVWYKSYKEGGGSGLATHQSARAPR